MSFFPQTLWDLLRPRRPRHQRAKTATPVGAAPRRRPMQERYDDLVAEMKKRYGIRVRKWRTSTSGCAWEVHYHDGTTTRLIEAPRPRGPVSCAIFLHEVGHHALGLRRFNPRCLEEYHAWAWSLRTMRERGFNVTPTVDKRMAESLRYALAKARRRGLKRIPAELMPYA